MNVDKAEDDGTQNTDSEKCEDDHNLLVIDIISENRNTQSLVNKTERSVVA